MALLYEAQGRYAEAEPLYQRSLAIVEKALGPEHPHVATSLNNLARLYRDQGHYAEAEPLYQRSLEIREKALGPEHPDVARSLISLGLGSPPTRRGSFFKIFDDQRVLRMMTRTRGNLGEPQRDDLW